MPQSQATATCPGALSFRGTSFHPVPLHSGQSSLAISPSYFAAPHATIRLPCGNLWRTSSEQITASGEQESLVVYVLKQKAPIQSGLFAASCYLIAVICYPLTGHRSLCTGHLPHVLTTLGPARTIACFDGRSSDRDAMRDNSCCTTCAKSFIWRSISIIFSRILRIISMPARLTPISRASVRITSSRSRSASVYSRVLPCERDGFNKPTRSYNRSVCGCTL